MLTLCLAIFVILFVLITAGDFFTYLYEQLSKEETNYNFFEKFLLGLCFLVLPLEVWSLFLPSNHVFLFICLSLSLLYWILRRDVVLVSFKKCVEVVKSLSTIEIISIVAFILITIVSCSWIEHSYDAEFYHYQNIFWNENYKIVPGLGNIEERFAFNSNFFLFSAIFSFSILTGEPIFAFNVAFVLIMTVWVFVETFKNKVEAKNIALLIAYLSLVSLTMKDMSNSSTDIIPNFIPFYLLAMVLGGNKILEGKKLLFFILPILLLTFKISGAPICLLSLYILYLWVKGKQWQLASIMTVLGFGIVAVWLLRNVIVSGYLVYPVSSVDLFSVDWKIPVEIAKLQQAYIKDEPYIYWKGVFDLSEFKDGQLFLLVKTVQFLFLALISIGTLGIVAYRLIEKRKEIKIAEALVLISVISMLLLSASNGIAPRFMYGSVSVLFFYMLYYVMKPVSSNTLAKVCGVVCVCFLAYYGLWSLGRVYKRVETINYLQTQKNVRGASTSFYRQYPSYLFMEAIGNNHEGELEDILLDNKFDVKRAVREYSRYEFPVVVAFESVLHSKFTDYRCLRTRGAKLEDGFSLDHQCMIENLKQTGLIK